LSESLYTTSFSKVREDEERLVAVMIELAHQYGHCGIRCIAALLGDAGMQINDKCMERKLSVTMTTGRPYSTIDLLRNFIASWRTQRFVTLLS